MKYKNPGDMFNAMKSGKMAKKEMAHSKQAVSGLAKFVKEEKGEKMKKKVMKPKPKGKGIVKALGQKGTTGNFKKIAKKAGKGAAIAALQNKLAKRRGKPMPFKKAKASKKGKKMAC